MTMNKDTHARVSGSGADRRIEAAVDPSGTSKKRRSTFTAWWFARKLIVLVLFAGALTGGLYLGFVFLGKGSAGDAFDVSNYKHIYDLIFSDS